MLQRVLLIVAVLFHSFLGTTSVHADLIAAWDFQTTTTGGTAAAVGPNSPIIYNANFGSGTLLMNGQNGSSNWLAASEINSFAGANLNVNVNGTPTLSATTTGAASLALMGGAGTSANGKSIVFAFNMNGFENLGVTYATQGTSTGFNSQRWEFSTNGTTWTSAGSAIVPPTNFAVQTLSTITGLDNVSTAFLRTTFTGATNAGGNNRLDNIQFNATAVPEPSSIALVSLMGCTGLVATYRRRKAKSKVA